MIVSIIILTYNGLYYTKLCVQSLQQYTNEPYELIFVDNGSTDGTLEYLKTIKDTKVIENKTNLGFAKGNNQGIACANGDYILFVNNDVVFTTDWLTKMSAHFQYDEKIGLLGPRTNKISGKQKTEVPYDEDDLNAMQEFAKEYSLKNANTNFEISRLVAFCLLVKKDVIDKIGNFDERFLLGNFEDDDLCLRAINAGFKLIVANDVFVHHFQSKSFKENKINYHVNFMQNRQRFLHKWKLSNTTFYGYSYNFPEIKNIMPADVKTLLDVGCCTGAFGALLKKKQNIEITGIEISPVFAQVAQINLDRVIIGDVEKLNLQNILKPAYFDCITCIDILEHLNNPYKFIMDLSRYIKPNGYFIASFPNILYFEIIKELIEGNWEYKDYGILDKDHLHFFNLRDIEELFKFAGLNIQSVHILDNDMNEYFEKLTDELFNMGFKQLKSAGNVYEYIIIGQKIHHQDNQTAYNIPKNLFLIPDISKYNNWQGKRILEITPDFGKEIKQSGAEEVVGIDIEQKQNTGFDSIIYSSDLKNIPFDFPLRYFDFIIINDMAKIKDTEEFINYLKKYLKDNGIIFFYFSNLRFFNIITGLLSGLGLYELNTPIQKDDIRLFTLKSITEIMDKSGFSLIQLGGLKYDFNDNNTLNYHLKALIDLFEKHDFDVSTLVEETNFVIYVMAGLKKELSAEIKDVVPSNFILWQSHSPYHDLPFSKIDEYVFLPLLAEFQIADQSLIARDFINIQCTSIENFKFKENAKLNICRCDEIVINENTIKKIEEEIDQLWLLTQKQVDLLIDSEIKNSQCYLLIKEKVYILPLGIDVDYFSKTTKSLEISGSRKYNFLCFWDEKNINTIVSGFFEEFTDKDDISLIIYLNGYSEDCAVQIINTAADNSGINIDNIPDIILLKQKILHKDLPALLKAGDCFICSQNKLVENMFYSLCSMSISLPVISIFDYNYLDSDKEYLNFYHILNTDMENFRKYLRFCYENVGASSGNYFYVRQNHDYSVIIEKIIENIKMSNLTFHRRNDTIIRRIK